VTPKGQCRDPETFEALYLHKRAAEMHDYNEPPIRKHIQSESNNHMTNDDT